MATVNTFPLITVDASDAIRTIADGLPTKSTPVSADKIQIIDTEDSNSLKSTTIADLAFRAAAIQPRVLKDAAAFTLTSSDIGKIILVDTQGTINQGEISVTLPSISSLSSYPGAWFILKKVATNTHPGKMTITTPVTATTTGSASASSTALTVTSGTGIVAGQVVVAPDTSAVSYRPLSGIQAVTKVSSVVGTAVTLSKQTTNALSGATINFYIDSIDGGGPRGFEIPGQAVLVYCDGVSNWEVLPQQMSTLGTPITGHHTVPGGTYTVASPYNADPSTQNTQLFEFTPDSGGASTNMKVNLSAPSLLADGYTPSTLTLMRSDKYSSYLPLFYTPNATWLQADSSTYPFALEGFGDVFQLYTDGGEYRTIGHYDAHQSGICEVVVSGTSSSPTSESYATPATTIYLVPKNYASGDHIALPCSTATTNYAWQVRRVQSVVSHLLSSSTYGYAAGNSATHNIYVWVAPDGSLQLLLGQANAGTAEYTTIDNASVNTSALSGGIVAKSARLVGHLLTDGTGKATQIFSTSQAPTYFATGYPGSGTSAYRVGINTYPPTAGNPTQRVYAAYPDVFASTEWGGSGVATTIMQADATQALFGTTGSFPINFRTNSVTRWTIGSSNGGFYSASATGGSKGADTINTNGYYLNGSQFFPRTTPTRQVFTSGSGTYTTPANVLWIEVEAVGGGGGGAGSGTSGSGGSGGAGGDTTFSTFTASGGAGGNTVTGGSGGGATGSPQISTTGGRGGSGYTTSSSGSGYGAGGDGGSSRLGGNGGGGPQAGAGTAGAANTGGGGGGGGAGLTASTATGAGGGGGGYFRTIITSPSATYSYAVGAAGTAGSAGTSGFAGAAGGSGGIVVTEYYGS